MPRKKDQSESEVNTETETVMDNETTTALAPAPTAALSVPAHHPDNIKLAQGLPVELRERALKLWRPTASEMQGLIEALPSNVKAKVEALLNSLSPDDDGLLGDYEQRIAQDIKLYHGVGNDPLRPRGVNKGEFYGSNGQEFGGKFVGAVLGLSDGRTLWPPKGSASNSPVCYSHDGRMGSEFGVCDNCEYAAKKIIEGGCARDLTVYMVDNEFTGLYAIKFTKTSYKYGTVLRKILSQSKVPWAKWTQFEAGEETANNNKYHVIKASTVTSKNPADVIVAPELLPVFRALSSLVQAEVYLPKVVKLYARGEGEKDVTPQGEIVQSEAGIDTSGDYSL